MNERIAGTLLALTFAGCALPADEPTGLELSWRFVEVNTDDGEESQRLRTCDGGFIEEVVFTITDPSDVTRSDTFRYPCTYGYLTPAEFQTDSSDAFVELRPREYDVQVDIVERDPSGGQRTRRARDLSVDVLDRTLTLQDFDFGLEPVRVSLSFSGIDSCDEAELALRYDNPEAALAEPPRADDGTAVSQLLYRESLATDQGVSLAGQATSCADLGGAHEVAEVDPGDYTLHITRDGVACALALAVSRSGAEHVIDLANLPCDG